jgi:hypothetical protein
MIANQDGDGGIQYRSRGGLIAFGVWSLFILALVRLAAWNAVVSGEPPWFAVIWIAGILLLGFYCMSLQVILTPHGELVFRGLLRRQTWRVTDLLSVRPENLCIVFKFRKGGVMVASWDAGEWLDLCRRIKELNPRASLNVPGMFRLPLEPDGDDSEP